MILDVTYVKEAPRQISLVRKFTSSANHPDYWLVWFYNRPEPVKLMKQGVREIHITND